MSAAPAGRPHVSTARRVTPTPATLLLVSLLAALYTGLVAGALWLNRFVPAEQTTELMTPLALAFGVHLVVGLVILAARGARPSARRIGWLQVITGLSAALYLFCLTLSTLAHNSGARSLAVTLSDWYLQWGWLGYAWSLALALPLLYPTGRVHSARWRPLWWLSLALLGALWFSAAFGVSTLEGQTPIANPFAIDSLPWLADVTRALDSAINIVAMLTLLSVFFRYRAANAEQRAQMRWLLYVVVLYASWSLVLLVARLLDSSAIPQVVSTAVYVVWVAFFGVAVGLALLRYRLYDIDFLIRRTLVYSIVTGLLLLVYLGAVLLLQALTIRMTGQVSEVAIALSTLAIAALFNPLRLRVHEWIDRRFYRSRYDAERIVGDFTRVVQHEPDLKRLTDELVAVIQATVHPTAAGVWLAESERRPREHPNANP